MTLMKIIVILHELINNLTFFYYIQIAIFRIFTPKTDLDRLILMFIKVVLKFSYI